MNCRSLLHRIVVIPLAITVYTLLSCGETEYPSPFTPSEDDTTVFSGRVVDENGDPVAGLALVIEPNEVGDNIKLQASDADLEVATDASGQFSITDIRPGSWRLSVIPYAEIDGEPTYGILSIKIGEISLEPDFHLHTLSSFDRTAFSITPGVHVQNVEIVVQQRMRIRAKVVFTDGTPLVHAALDISIKTRNLNGRSGGSLRGLIHTDAKGYLERYVNRIGFYTVSVEYDEISATSEEFLLNAGDHREDLILRLLSAPQ